MRKRVNRDRLWEEQTKNPSQKKPGNEMRLPGVSLPRPKATSEKVYGF